MHIPSWLLAAAAVLVAIPCGSALGVVAAYAIVGPNIGQLPILTVPVGIAAAIAFALAPIYGVGLRLAILVAAACLLIFSMP